MAANEAAQRRAVPTLSSSYLRYWPALPMSIWQCSKAPLVRGGPVQAGKAAPASSRLVRGGGRHGGPAQSRASQAGRQGAHTQLPWTGGYRGQAGGGDKGLHA